MTAAEIAALRAQIPRALNMRLPCETVRFLCDAAEEALRLRAESVREWLCADHRGLVERELTPAEFAERIECMWCLKTERDGLEKALRRYGDHTKDCDIWLTRGGLHHPYPCTCGFDAALKGTP